MKQLNNSPEAVAAVTGLSPADVRRVCFTPLETTQKSLKSAALIPLCTGPGASSERGAMIIQRMGHGDCFFREIQQGAEGNGNSSKLLRPAQDCAAIEGRHFFGDSAFRRDLVKARTIKHPKNSFQRKHQIRRGVPYPLGATVIGDGKLRDLFPKTRRRLICACLKKLGLRQRCFGSG